MLTLTVILKEEFDEAKNQFLTDKTTIRLEHSLVSLSKWESHYEIPFLSSNKTEEQLFWYIQAMCLDDNIAPEVFQNLSQNNVDQINQYISAKMTATWFSPKPNQTPSREIITAELIYYWMIAYNIPVEFEHWHLKRLLTLIEVCNHKNQPAKKMSKAEVGQQQRALNAKRKAEMGTRG